MSGYALAVQIGKYVDSLSEREQTEINRVIDVGMQICNAAYRGRYTATLFDLTSTGISMVCEVRLELVIGWAYNTHNPNDRVPARVPDLGPCICGECSNVS